MSELRWHPLLEEWVTVAPWRQDRTYHPPEDHCPLCPTRPGKMETEIPEPDYHIAVFENRFPSFTGEQGRCEVVCYTPDHESSLGAQSVRHIRDLIEVWRDRTRELASLPNVRYVFVFENRGEEIGVTLHHPHGQIYAYPFVPPVLQRELRAETAHRDKTGRCLYCDLLEGEAEGARTVLRDERWIAFVPVKGVLQKYDALFQKPLPYVMAMHQSTDGGPSAEHHFHVEFYPPNRTRDKLKYLAGSELGAGAFIVDARAEDKAAELRGR